MSNIGADTQTATGSETEAKCPVMAFDHESPAYARAWTAQDPATKTGCPMSWNTHHGGFWFATGYEEIVRISRDPTVFTNGKEFDPATGKVTGGLAIPPVPAPRVIPDETDGEEWRGFRKLINKAFTPKQAEAQRERARAFATSLVVGGAGFKSAPVDGVVEIGYGLAASARGRGLAEYHHSSANRPRPSSPA